MKSYKCRVCPWCKEEVEGLTKPKEKHGWCFGFSPDSSTPLIIDLDGDECPLRASERKLLTAAKDCIKHYNHKKLEQAINKAERRKS